MTSNANFNDFNLHKPLLSSLEFLKLKRPTRVQSEVIPLALKKKDVLVCSETGSGKTLAYLLPIFQHLIDNPPKSAGTIALILLPTRELAQQVYKLCDSIAGFTKLRTALITGGQEYLYQASLLRKDPEIVIATPGRLTDFAAKGDALLDQTRYLVLDEADRMLDMGFRDDVLALTKRCHDECQTMMLSATLKHRGIASIAADTLKNPETIQLSQPRSVNSNIHQQMILTDDAEHKLKVLKAIVEQELFDKLVVFVNKRIRTEEICSFLETNITDKTTRINRLHGEMRQDERKRIMANFRQKNFNVLIATDLAARGLDIDGVNLVVNFDMAHSGDEYTHRVGRTGRGAEKGLAISLVSSYDWNLSESIQRYLSQPFERRVIKGLKAKFSGPSKAKAAAKKAKKKAAKADNGKQRLRDKKNVGKRREPKHSISDREQQKTVRPIVNKNNFDPAAPMMRRNNGRKPDQNEAE